MFKRLKKAFNRNKEDKMTKEQILKAIKSLTPEEQEEIKKGFKEPDIIEEKVEDIAEEKIEEKDEDPMFEDKKENVIEEKIEPEIKQETSDLNSAITVALAPVLVQIAELKNAIQGISQEPQKAPKETQDKLNKLQKIYS